jgi:hypothetical protein
MKTVILYFPYIINLRAFVATENLENVTIDPADLFLKTSLNEAQIEKAFDLRGCNYIGMITSEFPMNFTSQQPVKSATLNNFSPPFAVKKLPTLTKSKFYHAV